MITHSGFQLRVIARTGKDSPSPDRTLFRTPTIDTSKRGTPPVCPAANLFAIPKASSVTVSPVSNNPSRARMAMRMA
jgi:hypothetical protein